MRKFIIFYFLVSSAVADCNLEPEQIKPRIQRILFPLHDQINLFIPKADFVLAHSEVAQVQKEVSECAEYHREYEYENYHFKRWGEKSSVYDRYSSSITSVAMQLDAAHESFEFGLLRPLIFKTSMWEKVAKEFYERKI